MKDAEKTKDQLIEEIRLLRLENERLRESEATARQQEEELRKYLTEMDESRELIEEQAHQLIVQADLIESANEELRKAYARIETDMQTVAALQRLLLPDNVNCEAIECAYVKSFYKPSSMASGDYFDFFRIRGNVLRIIMADVSGHGARAAFITAIVRTLFHFTRNYYVDLKRIIGMINSHLCSTIGEEADFVALFAADVNMDNGQVEWVNAGHTPGMARIDGGNIRRLQSYAPALGFFEHDYIPKSFAFKDKINIFLFTDGFYEWKPASGKNILGLERFWKMSSELFRKQTFFHDELMHKCEAIARGEPDFKDDLAALWVQVTRMKAHEN